MVKELFITNGLSWRKVVTMFPLSHSYNKSSLGKVGSVYFTPLLHRISSIMTGKAGSQETGAAVHIMSSKEVEL